MPEPETALGASDPTVRARAAAMLGHGRWPAGTSARLSELVERDPVPAVRRAALATLVARARPGRALRDWTYAAHDGDDGVRRAAADIATRFATRLCNTERTRPGTSAIADVLVELIDDRAPLVAETSAFALGEIVAMRADGQTSYVAMEVLIRNASDHADALVREACVAALGSMRAADVKGTEAALTVVLAAARDKPAIRRRAVIALSAFDSPAAENGIREALTDRDWQVRQLAEDLLA
ncbi:MAG TPA: HEAT repeat domain-containing protein [Acidimicrobiia bacterium]